MIDKLSFLKGGSDGAGVSAEEERLMQLFQNRAGLKKAYADLKDEFHLLRDRLKQQEGATIRVQEQLDALGDLLADPRTGFGALVFFQLRGLWKICHQQLSTFTSDLTRQQEAKETARHNAECEAAKNARLADVERRLQSAASDADLNREQLAGAQNELQRLTAFWHYFKRRRLQKSLESLRQGVVSGRCGGRRPACGEERHRQRSAAGVSRHIAECAPQHQSCHHQLRGVAVRARGRVRPRGAGQRGGGAARP